jgi:hypothetical protein
MGRGEYMSEFIREANQKTKDNLLQILLYKEYQIYRKSNLLENHTTEEKYCIKFPMLSFDEGLEKILDEF